MARMVRMIVSIPAEDKKWLEAESRRRKISVSELIRIAIREFQQEVEAAERRVAFARVAEKSAAYKDLGQPTENNSDIESIIDKKELWRRAVAAAGRFASGVPDLSIEHDRYAWGDYGAEGIEESEGTRGEQEDRTRSRHARVGPGKTGGGSRGRAR